LVYGILNMGFLGRLFGGGDSDRIAAYTKKISDIPAEIIEMIEQDMTVEEALEHHRKVWDFSRSGSLRHELTHIMLGVILGRGYQGTGEAEVLTTTLEGCFSENLSSHESNITQWIERNDFKKFDNLYQLQALQIRVTNLSRTIYWLVQQHTGWNKDEMAKNGFHKDDPFAIFMEQSGDTVRNEAVRAMLAPYGITTEYQPANNVGIGIWQVECKEKVYRGSVIDPANDVLPSGSNGVEEFTPYAPRSSEEAWDIAKKIVPAAKKFLATSYGPNYGPYIPVYKMCVYALTDSQRSALLDGINSVLGLSMQAIPIPTGNNYEDYEKELLGPMLAKYRNPETKPDVFQLFIDDLKSQMGASYPLSGFKPKGEVKIRDLVREINPQLVAAIEQEQAQAKQAAVTRGGVGS
jgi:hypothetical protein